MVVSFEFFATDDPPLNNALSEGFDSLLRGIFGQAGFWGGSG